MSLECKLAKLTLNFDMSGMVQPCNLTNWYLKNLKTNENFNVLNDEVKDIWNSEHRKKLLEDHKNGIKNPTCKVCWDHEDAGIESIRQRMNKQLQDIEVSESQPKIVILKPGNLCNNACRSCNAYTSSMWYKDDFAINHKNKNYKEYLDFFHRYKKAYTNNNKLEKTFFEWNDDMILWDMYGGEPLIIPLFYKILDHAILSKNVKNKQFNVHTNGMIYKSDLIKKLSNFKKSYIGFSIDAIGEKNNYIRYGSNWAGILDNLQKYLKDCKNFSNVELSIRYTITPLNVFYFDEIYKFFKKMNIKSGGSWCTDTTWNDIRYLPYRVKKGIVKKLSDCGINDPIWKQKFLELKKWIELVPTNYETFQNSFIEYNSKIDLLRKEKFQKIFPEYAKLFEVN